MKCVNLHVFVLINAYLLLNSILIGGKRAKSHAEVSIGGFRQTQCYIHETSLHNIILQVISVV